MLAQRIFAAHWRGKSPDAAVGVHAARVAVRILHGEASSSIPSQLLEIASPVYDWRGPRRSRIAESQLSAAAWSNPPADILAAVQVG